jgi:hypothetical protein
MYVGSVTTVAKIAKSGSWNVTVENDHLVTLAALSVFEPETVYALLTGPTGGYLYGLDYNTGEELWNVYLEASDMGGSTPVIHSKIKTVIITYSL